MYFKFDNCNATPILLIHCLLLTKFSQAQKVGQIQHPEYALKLASLVEPVV
jgi:hypothetical protein